MEYKNRIADQVLQDKLNSFGATLITGPKKGWLKVEDINFSDANTAG